MLRFQYLINAQIQFKVDSQLLNSEELNYLVNRLVGLGNHHRYLFVVYNSDDSIRVLHTRTLEVFEEIIEYQLFVPEQEVLLTNRQIFVMFLKKHRKYASYKRNYAQLHRSYQDDSDVTDFLMSAYDWINTPEGHEYWSNLDSEWGTMVFDLNLTNRT